MLPRIKSICTFLYVYFSIGHFLQSLGEQFLVPAWASSLCASLWSAPRLPRVRLVFLAHRPLRSSSRLPRGHVRRLLHLLLLLLHRLLLDGSHVAVVVPASLQLTWRLLAGGQGIFEFRASFGLDSILFNAGATMGKVFCIGIASVKAIPLLSSSIVNVAEG